MAYTAKYASAFYGPFREALASAPKPGSLYMHVIWHSACQQPSGAFMWANAGGAAHRWSGPSARQLTHECSTSIHD